MQPNKLPLKNVQEPQIAKKYFSHILATPESVEQKNISIIRTETYKNTTTQVYSSTFTSVYLQGSSHSNPENEPAQNHPKLAEGPHVNAFHFHLKVTVAYIHTIA